MKIEKKEEFLFLQFFAKNNQFYYISQSIYMQKKTLESQESIREDLEQLQICCEICNMGTQQTKCIINHLLTELKPTTLQEQGQNIYDCGGFTKLLKLIFHSKCKNLRDTMKCPHIKIQTYFLQILGTNLSDLNKVSNKKIVSLAKYNFHADIISLQVKNFNRHFSIIQKKENKNAKRKETSPKTTISTVIGQKVNLQQKYQTSQNKQPNLQPLVKSQPQYNNHLVTHGEFLDYQQAPNGSFPYPMRFDNQFSQIMNNMLMINYGFHHPMNQN